MLSKSDFYFFIGKLSSFLLIILTNMFDFTFMLLLHAFTHSHFVILPYGLDFLCFDCLMTVNNMQLISSSTKGLTLLFSKNLCFYISYIKKIQELYKNF